MALLPAQVKRWMYRGNRPNRFARVLNHLTARYFSGGPLSSPRWATLEVPGRRTGRIIEAPIVVVDHEGGHYLVSMLGEEVNWVRNVRAAGGRAVLVNRRRRRAVRLAEVDPSERAPILRRYLDLAPGARPHIPVRRRAPLREFERVAGRYPVFRVLPEDGRPW